MAYVPPHKRHPTEIKGRTLTPDLLETKFKKTCNLSPVQNSNNIGKVAYADNAINRWIPIGLDEDKPILSSVRLQSFLVEAFKQSMGAETLELVNTALDSEGSQARGKHWVTIAENVLDDLVSRFEVVRNEMRGQNSESVKPALVVRLGKILFHNKDPSKTVEAVGCSPTKASLRCMKKIFYGQIIQPYMDHIEREAIPNIGVEFLQEKSIYHVKLCDTWRDGFVISCRCGVAEEASRLTVYKLEFDRVRHMTVNISCLDKNLDLRLALQSKRSIPILTKEERNSITYRVQSAVLDANAGSGILTEEEMKSIIDLVTSAVPDGNVKGGLLWPSGKISSRDRFQVDEVWHTTSKIYGNSSIRLKLRRADPIIYRNTAGEVATEVVVKLKGISTALVEQKLEMDSISDMLKGELKLIWEHFLK